MTTKGLGKTWGVRLLFGFGLLSILIWPFSGIGQSTQLTVADATLVIPTSAGDRLGAPNSMTVADFNDDGFMDILVGAPFADHPASGSTTADNGIAYIIYGKKPFPREIDLKSFTNADVVFIGRDFGDHLGTAVAAGDVNGDGIPDIILGAPDADGPLNQDSETGEVYVFWGSTALPREIDLKKVDPPVTLIGRESRAGFGSTLTALDLNGDGLQDVVIGQPDGDGPGGSRPSGGVVFVHYGATNLISPVPDVGFKKADLTIYGADAGDTLGAALTEGDFNGDGHMDLAIGAPLADGPANVKANAGEVYILSGSSSLPSTIDLAGSTTTGTGSLQVIGADAGDRLGTALDAGDANKDGFDDLLIGAPMGGGPDNTRGFGGEAYLVLGRKDLSPVIEADKNGDIAIEIYGAEALNGLGNAVVLSDIDGDGFADLVVAASNAKGAGGEKAGAGRVIMIKGRGAFPKQFDLANEEPNAVAHGDQTGAAFGSALAVGHLEGDEKGNLLVGAMGADGPGGRTDSGLVYVFLTVEKEPPTVPVADAGPDWCTLPGVAVTLSAAESKDPGGNPLTYRWEIVSQPEGGQGTLSSPDTVETTFTADALGEYVIRLTLTTPQGATATDEVSVFVLRKGDVNFDGVIDQTDAQMVADYIVGLIVFTPQQVYAADVRPPCLPEPNAVDVNDVRWIAEFPFKGAQEPTCKEPYAKPRVVSGT